MTMTDPAPDKTGKNTSLPAEDTKTAKDTALPDLNHGLQIIRDMARRLDTSPGVYRMLGHDGQVLYVGSSQVVATAFTNLCGTFFRCRLIPTIARRRLCVLPVACACSDFTCHRYRVLG